MPDDTISLNIDTEEELREYNIPLYGIHGQFSLTPGVTVPYFATLLTIRRVTTELKTHEEIAPSLDNRYTLIELFQRQIDTERVRTEIVNGYLKAHSKLKFFNSITVALFPKDEHGKIAPHFVDYPNNDPTIPVEAAGKFDESFQAPSCEKIIFGGVQYVKAKAANLARLRWDRQRIDAVAVDGQHRLNAIKQWFSDKNQELTELEKPTRLSVIFLLLHERAGFEKSASDAAGSIKAIAREIFTDLNKNAKEVDLATQIILDDRSLESRCVRALMTSSTCEDSPKLLPLSLLRWREANNRFDHRYFLNSLVNLHLLVKDILGLQLPGDPMDAREVRKYIKSLEDCLGSETDGRRSLNVDGKSLREYYDSDYFDAGADDTEAPIRPFVGIPPIFLPAAVDGFKKFYSDWMLTILRDFQPYRELLNYARQENLIEGQFSQFQSQPESAREQLQNDLASEHGEQWHERVIGRHERFIQGIKATGNHDLGEQWAFKTIFQKALLRLGKQLALTLTDDERERFGTVSDMIAFMDSLYQKDILRVLAPLPGQSQLFWTFLAINYGNRKIRVTRQTEKKIEDLLRLAYLGFRFARVEGKAISIIASETTLTPRAILQALSPRTAHMQWGTHEAAQSLIGLFIDNSPIISPALAQAEADGSMSEDILKKEKAKVGRDRLVALLAECWIDSKNLTTAEAETTEPADDDGMI